MPDVERGARGPEECRRDRRQDGLLEIEAIGDVEDRERGQEAERDVERATAAPVQVVRRDEERERDRHGKRVGPSHHIDRLDAEEDVPAPGDVRRDCGNEVDDRDNRDTEGRERGDVVKVARWPEAQRAPMKAEPPRGRVAPGRRQVAPVLDDEPEPGERHAPEGHQAEHADEGRYTAEPQDGEPEMPFVDPAAEHVDADPEWMVNESQHAYRVAYRPETCGSEGELVEGEPIPQLLKRGAADA